MSENRINVTDLIQTDEDGNSYIPYKVDIRLVNARSLRAIAKVEYAHTVIADISIIEHYGRISIQFPSKEFTTRDGEKKFTSVAFPSKPEVSRELNRGIMQAYKDKCQEEYLRRISNTEKD